MLHIACFDWETPRHLEKVGDEWIDTEAEQRADEITPEPLTSIPVPDRLITDISFVGDKVMTTCRQSGAGRPIYHDFDLSDDRADTVIKLCEDNYFRFSVKKNHVHLSANELIVCPFCRKS